MPILSPFWQNSQRTFLCFLSIVTAITLTPWKPAEADENDGPVIRLHGKVILPGGVGNRNLVGELVERVRDRSFDFEVTPIELKENMTFETQTKGQSRSYIIVRTLDRKWKGSWACQAHELLTKSADEIELKMVLVKPRAAQVTYD